MQWPFWLAGIFFGVLGAIIALVAESFTGQIIGCLLLLTGVVSAGFGTVVEAVRRAFPAADMAIHFGDAEARAAAKTKAALKSAKLYVPPEPDFERPPSRSERAERPEKPERHERPERPERPAAVVAEKAETAPRKSAAAAGETPSRKTAVAAKKPVPPPPPEIKRPPPPPPALLELQQAQSQPGGAGAGGKTFVPPDH
jgi:hypothetical protein